MSSPYSLPEVPELQTASQLQDSVPPRKPPVLTAVGSGEGEEPKRESHRSEISNNYTTRIVESSNRVGEEQEETRLEMAKRLATEVAVETIEFFTGIDL